MFLWFLKNTQFVISINIMASVVTYFYYGTIEKRRFLNETHPPEFFKK